MEMIRKVRKISKVLKDIDIEGLDLSSLQDLDIGGIVENMDDIYISIKLQERLLLAICDKISVELNSENLKSFVNAIYEDIKKQRQKEKEKKIKEDSNKEDD